MTGVPHPPLVSLRARRLRREDGLTITQISTMLRVPRSTVHGWVRDIPAVYESRCKLCGEEFTLDAVPARREVFCSDAHRRKYFDLGWQYREAA